MSRTPLQPQPIEGSRAWVITDGKAGSESQARGIADGLELDWRLIRVAPTGLTKLIAPFGRPNRADRFGEPGSVFAPPWPDIAIAIGRRSMPYLRAVKRAHAATVTIALLDPKAGLGVADLIWVPEHDKLRGPNVITTLTAPHGFSPRRLAELRAHPPHAIAALPGPRLAVMLGGQNAVYRFSDRDHDRLTADLSVLSTRFASVMLTPSRRTHQALRDAALRATADMKRLVYNGGEANPYADFLANADAIVTTADSISMTAEATATGRPVFVFHPSHGSAKFDRFHSALELYGATRQLTAASATDVAVWRYQPINAADAICEALRARIATINPDRFAAPTLE